MISLIGKRGMLLLRMSDKSSQEQLMDDLILKMAEAAPYELPNIASQNLKEISSPKFFLRIASMSDESQDETRKQQLSALADNLVATLEVVVQRTEEKLDDAAELIQGILSSAAEPNGEFIVPLKADKINTMRKKVSEKKQNLGDEGVLATVFAYMKKASEDRLDGMVVICQKLLQMWAAEELLAAGTSDEVLGRILRADADQWGSLLEEVLKGEAPQTDKDTLSASVQSCVEKVVLQKASGSYGQRVQAEFLRELMSKIREVSAEAAK
ncbi:hypothetical protein GUITHDRAFT_120938 [Guillardia theta CCMP2712]|uniref:Uncharacterized protein n=1 Tax=Guillardia theta (strain CCMP2712) TaxID=905079 RepID=L1I9F2_GUITC|nr:hypothetical protein GUITHDRAFT_120938 [Guillardia theta CCMP2712]EKX32871.1 hypothetical protein GUITHDRAFT_120938 [Guillardia theta CCMP2712]|eukprot:XP_005819851.1 hypothetical protein GUITHDRAFT_120938 [Guillardia theta CCMP2712]